MFRKLFRGRQPAPPSEEATKNAQSVRQAVTVSETAVLEVLSMFAKPADPTQRLSEGWASIWHEKLGTSFLSVTDALEGKGLLRRATRLERLLQTHCLSELKALARTRGIKVSGRKADVAQRILDTDGPSAHLLIGGENLVVCSDEALAEVNKHQEGKKAEERAAKAKTKAQLQAGQLVEACQTVSDYEASRFFSRGIGVDWTREAARILPEVKAAFERTPKYHQRRFGSVSPDIRISAAMAMLWGERASAEEAVSACLPSDQRQLAQRMLEFHTHYLRDLEQLRALASSALDIKGEILVTEDANTTCAACLADAAKVYELRDVPELPHEHCDCEIGCRCTLIGKLPEED